MICFYGKELLAPHPIPKLEDYTLSAVRGCLFNTFAATLQIGGRSSIRNLRTRHAVVTGTHLSRTLNPYSSFNVRNQLLLQTKQQEKWQFCAFMSSSYIANGKTKRAQKELDKGGFTRLRLGTSGGLLSTRPCKFGFHKRRNFWASWGTFSSQRDLFSRKLGSCGAELFFTPPQEHSWSSAFHFMHPEGWLPYSEKPRVQSALGPVIHSPPSHPSYCLLSSISYWWRHFSLQFLGQWGVWQLQPTATMPHAT